MNPVDIDQMKDRLNQASHEINKLELKISVMICTAVILVTWFSKPPDIEKALRALSWSCFITAGLILCYLIFDWVRVSRRIRADMSFDPMRRPQPDYLKRQRHKFKP